MSLKIAICDDVSTDRDRLLTMIYEFNINYGCSTYDSGESLLWDLENGKHFDIIFLDIFMNGINGVETAKRIRTENSNVHIIFVSSSDDFYRESYDLYAFNYLIKPLKKQKLNEVLDRAVTDLNKDSDQLIRFSYDNRLHTINCSQLLYLTSEKHNIYFHLLNNKKLKAYGKIDDFISQLPSKVFLRCHQSYIVNLKHVTQMTSSEFIIDEIKVPISRKYSTISKENYRNQMFGDF
jgi:DNA-binding LytR/AlgR family response regulator